MQPKNYHLILLIERVFILSGLVMALMLFVGLWPLAGFLPPPEPSASAEEIARVYADNTTGIIAGSVMVMSGAGFYLLFCLALAAAMERHCSSATLLSRAQLLGAVLNVAYFTFIGLFWLVAAYRADADATEVRLFNDIAWMIMVVPTAAVMIQMLSVGFVALMPPDGDRIFPRWAGFFNFWCAMLFVPGLFSGFFYDGPIAWDGILSFWLEVVVYWVWLIVVVSVLLKALPRSNGSHGSTV